LRPPHTSTPFPYTTLFRSLSAAKYRADLAKNHRLAREEGIDLVVRKNRLDALVAPTGGPAWLTDLVNGDGGTAAAPGPSSVAARSEEHTSELQSPYDLVCR